MRCKFHDLVTGRDLFGKTRIWGVVPDPDGENGLGPVELDFEGLDEQW
jgi:hypothetical protein